MLHSGLTLVEEVFPTGPEDRKKTENEIAEAPTRPPNASNNTGPNDTPERIVNSNKWNAFLS